MLGVQRPVVLAESLQESSTQYHSKVEASFSVSPEGGTEALKTAPVQASPEPEAPKRRRRHRSSKDDASGGKRKRRKHRSRAEPSMTPEPAPEERDAERPHR